MTQREALDILKTGANVFLTGEPGSGKTHTVNQYAAYLRNHEIEPAITASTGIAATHIGGMTIHSWSGLGIKRKLDKYDIDRIASKEYVVKRVRRIKVLVIDEVSMLSSETLSMIDAVCREIKQNSLPFGGIQVIFVGDFFQLPPIVKKDTENDRPTLLAEEPLNHFAYNSFAWKKASAIVCYLTEQYRQDDADFLFVLSSIRRDSFGEKHLRHIESRKIEYDFSPDGVPKLFSHNVDVDYVNNEMLAKISGKPEVFFMRSRGSKFLAGTLKKSCLSPEKLYLKVGAAVMFTKNNIKEGFVNGTLGSVERFDKVSGYPIVKIRNGRRVEVEPMDWQMEENGRVLASITQLPLRLAWAITVHKSQGMSLDAAVMDLSNVFEYGQGYVALSRIRRLSGLHILGWNEKAFKVHPEILSKDKSFYEASIESIKAFSKIPPEELAKMHQNFIIACGGKNFSERESFQNEFSENAYGGKKSFQKIRQKYPNAYLPWEKEQDKKLLELFAKGQSFSDLAKIFGRQKSAIKSRLSKLGMAGY